MALLPLRGSGTRGDQVENAEFFEKAGAALVLRSRSGGAVTPEDLAALIRELAENPQKLAALAAAAARIGQTDGAAVIAGVIEAALAGGPPSASPDIPWNGGVS
jgi:UDP-N-acetylglucosamine--N-acetylmuramyl-(pentapeptide) pyrophosphoryl-undecaprenol N-acetylglucosamine transferase